MANPKGSLSGGRELTQTQQKDAMLGNLLKRMIDHANDLQQQINKVSNP